MSEGALRAARQRSRGEHDDALDSHSPLDRPDRIARRVREASNLHDRSRAPTVSHEMEKEESDREGERARRTVLVCHLNGLVSVLNACVGCVRLKIWM